MGALAFAPHFAEARAALARFQPALTEGMTPAAIANGATYSCAGMTMDRWELPGIAAMEIASSHGPIKDATDEGASAIPASDLDEASTESETEGDGTDESGSAV